MGHKPPGRASAGQPAQRIEHFVQAVAQLGRLLVNQGKVGSHEIPFFVAHVTGAGLSWHPRKLRTTQKKSALIS